MADLRTRLTRLSQNLWWSWTDSLHPIFRAIDTDLWRRVNHNPIAFLQEVDPDRLAARERDANIVAQAIRAEKELREYMEGERHWASFNAPGLSVFPVAYFCTEFCIHESLPIYSGGLGVLAGDHLKSCSDLGICATGVSLLYRQGYFTQQIDAEGNQKEVYHDLDTTRVPLEPVLDGQGNPMMVQVPVADEQLGVQIWQARVGRCVLLLLDAIDAPGSFPRVPRLYGGDKTTRIVQEITLGVGGFRALRALGIRPGVMHLNEGHPAFSALEAISEKMEETGMPFAQAAAQVADSVVFTTHTPVTAGHDYFEPSMVLRFLRPLQHKLGLDDEAFLGLGRVDPSDPDEQFCMTVLAMKLSRAANAVSSLHSQVSRQMWQRLWPDRRAADTPIGHVTNGVHVATWLGMELDQLYGDCLGHDWKERVDDARLWQQIDELDEHQLWGIKLALKRKLLDFIARRLQRRRERLGISEPMPELHVDALTIGFARRFATYKRALLFFDDMERARRLLTDLERPVQVVIAGKAHPADEPAQSIIRRLVQFSLDPELRNHLVVIEDHDRNVGRHLLEGCDLWLNNPRRPFEACGTSGMKAVFNATLNCSTQDGWWDEAFDTKNGFAFGDGLTHTDHEIQDRRDAESLMQLLETRVVPLFYERNEQEMPEQWLGMVKQALKTLAWRYNSDRMVKDYVRRMYLRASNMLTADMPY